MTGCEVVLNFSRLNFLTACRHYLNATKKLHFGRWSRPVSLGRAQTQMERPKVRAKRLYSKAKAKAKTETNCIYAYANMNMWSHDHVWNSAGCCRHGYMCHPTKWQRPRCR